MNEASSPDQIAAATSLALRTNVADARDVTASLVDLAEQVQEAAAMLAHALLNGRALLCCGNGGSACDAAHFTAEIAGRYKIERPGFAAVDLTANNSLVTSLINDYPPAEVFARQVEGIGKPGDVLAVFTTSGNSDNVALAMAAARKKGIGTISFLGRDGGKCKGEADVELIINSQTTARIQEAHLLLYHTICEVLDPLLAEQG